MPTATLAGPLLIAFAAILWGMDAIFRISTLTLLDAQWVVLADHVIGFAILAGWVIYRFGLRIFQLERREWLAAIWIGAGGSAAATVLFTESLRYLNPSVPVLLQKLQPLWAVLLARVFLGERLSGRLLLWGAVAVGCAFILSFPDLNPGALGNEMRERSTYFKGLAFAFVSTVLWGVTTVSSKALLIKTPSFITVFWRYFFGMIALIVVLAWQGQPIPWVALESRSVMEPLAGLAILSGIVPMSIYYVGLARTPASVATFVELIYPLSAILMNLIFLDVALAPVQLAAGGVFLVAVIRLSL